MLKAFIDVRLHIMELQAGAQAETFKVCCQANAKRMDTSILKQPLSHRDALEISECISRSVLTEGAPATTPEMAKAIEPGHPIMTPMKLPRQVSPVSSGSGTSPWSADPLATPTRDTSHTFDYMEHF